MSYGLVTRNAEETDWEFDPVFYEVKSVSGRVVDPEPSSVSAIACFADTAAVAERPELAPRDARGRPATDDREHLDWSAVCPSVDEYREGLLETIADAAAVTGDVRLDEVGFPRAEYCRCERCEQSHAESAFADREAWRAATVEEFLAAARERVPGDLYVTLYPDPYPGRLRTRTGLDPAAVADHVDRFVVPLYDTAYGTTHWLESLARGFREELSVPFDVELYALNIDLDALVGATRVAAAYADGVSFGYEAGNARAAVRRMRAQTNDGETHGPD